jgi:hypothetical protein
VSNQRKSRIPEPNANQAFMAKGTNVVVNTSTRIANAYPAIFSGGPHGFIIFYKVKKLNQHCS